MRVVSSAQRRDWVDEVIQNHSNITCHINDTARSLNSSMTHYEIFVMKSVMVLCFARLVHRGGGGCFLKMSICLLVCFMGSLKMKKKKKKKEEERIEYRKNKESSSLKLYCML